MDRTLVQVFNGLGIASMVFLVVLGVDFGDSSNEEAIILLSLLAGVIILISYILSIIFVAKTK